MRQKNDLHTQVKRIKNELNFYLTQAQIQIYSYHSEFGHFNLFDK